MPGSAVSLFVMVKRSAGLLMFRRREGRLEVLLAHPGGPLWARKDQGVWSIPKGICEDRETPLETARREFTEETGLPAEGEFLPLGEVRQRPGKIVSAWAFEGDCDPAQVKSNLFELECPPRSGRIRSFPEVDRAGWFTIPAAHQKLLPGQRPFLDRLLELT